ncbi:LysR family transcriptional regulator [Advenella sp. S44]|uniref:LysR family transcriptional regulator n=1 Tax=Advenella sp. S44 TaxID=1982755 RepID=UPI0012905C89|nr:LysR family transcriptional regulator [Advenella sp. S44]
MKTRQPLPPLNSLKAFEASARLKSMALAAKELHVTPSAVSQQIKQLEHHLGQRVITQSRSGMVLTPYGRDALPKLSQAFDLLAGSFEHPRDPLLVRISVLPSFARFWLNPRLPAFFRQHSTIRLDIDSSPKLIDFTFDDLDLAIRYGKGQYETPLCDSLMKESHQAVCTARQYPAWAPLIESGDFARLPLIGDRGMLGGDDQDVTWREWLHAKAPESTLPDYRLTYTDSGLSVDAALAHQGVLLGRMVLLDVFLKEQKLVALDPLTLRSELGYFLLGPSLAGLSEGAQKFRQWLLQEAASYQTQHHTQSPSFSDR